jgi:hypothetical protein
MSMKAAELGRAWGMTRQRVSQMVKEGLPLGSLEEAQAWRLAHYGKVGSGHGPRPGRGDGAARPASGGSGADEGRVPGGPAGSDRAGSAFDGGANPVGGGDGFGVVLDGEDFRGTLKRLDALEKSMWNELAGAVKNGDNARIMTAGRLYQRAVDQKLMQVGKIMELLLKSGELVTLADAKALFGRHLESLRLVLKTMPSRLAARCNPSDPELAKTALNEAVARVFKTMNEWDV